MLNWKDYKIYKSIMMISDNDNNNPISKPPALVLFSVPGSVGPVSDEKFTPIVDMLGSPINFMRIQEVGRDISG